MPSVRWSRPALRDIARLYDFLAPINANAARRAVKEIRKCVKLLGRYPEIGRPADDLPLDFREWIIEFGQSAYVARYIVTDHEIIILAVRHGREARY